MSSQRLYRLTPLNKKTQEPPEKLAFSIEEAMAGLDLSRQKLYNEINAGRLRTYRVGKRRLVSRQAILDYIAAREREEGASMDSEITAQQTSACGILSPSKTLDGETSLVGLDAQDKVGVDDDEH